MTVTPAVRSGGASIIRYRLGGRDYPLRTVAQCKVCSSPHRFSIEEEIAAGRTFTMILRSLETLEPGLDLSTKNLRDHHANGHMPLEIEASRRIMERRAIERGVDMEKGVESLVDGLTLAEITVQKTAEALSRGEIKPDLKDGLLAARLLETFAPADTGANTNDYAQAFMVYHEVAQQVMTPSQFEEFGRLLGSNEVLRALVARYEGQAEDEQADEQPDEASGRVLTQRMVDNGDSDG